MTRIMENIPYKQDIKSRFLEAYKLLMKNCLEKKKNVLSYIGGEVMFLILTGEL